MSWQALKDPCAAVSFLADLRSLMAWLDDLDCVLSLIALCSLEPMELRLSESCEQHVTVQAPVRFARFNRAGKIAICQSGRHTVVCAASGKSVVSRLYPWR